MVFYKSFLLTHSGRYNAFAQDLGEGGLLRESLEEDLDAINDGQGKRDVCALFLGLGSYHQMTCTSEEC